LEFTIRKPDDFHVHFRDGEMMRLVVPETERHFGRALVMPNVPAIEDGRQADDYRARILDSLTSPDGDFFPLMTIKLTHRTTPEMIGEASEVHGVVAAKLYPEGATTGSHDGIRDVEELRPVLAAMRDCRMVLCIHGEWPEAFVLEREERYLPAVEWIVKHFPGLRVVLEHITTAAAVKFVEDASVNVAATITAHHLVLSLDDVLGQGIRPHHFCYPVAKTYVDRSALVYAVAHGKCRRFFFGSDTAPHRRHDKESACGCAGIFSAPVALSVLAGVFFGDEDHHNTLKHRQAALERFTSINGAEFYGLPLNEGTVTLADEPWAVPQTYDRDGDGGGPATVVVPFRAGERLRWRVASS
jgi:dihydroorotase